MKLESGALHKFNLQQGLQEYIGDRETSEHSSYLA